VILRTPVTHGMMSGGPTDGAGVSDLAHLDEPEYLLVIHVMPYRYRRRPMTDKHVLGPDIDLDVEVVRDKKVGGSPRPERSGSPSRGPAGRVRRRATASGSGGGGASTAARSAAAQPS